MTTTTDALHRPPSSSAAWASASTSTSTSSVASRTLVEALSSSLASFSAGLEGDVTDVTRLIDEGDNYFFSSESSQKQSADSKAGRQLDRRRRHHHRDVATSFVDDVLLGRVGEVEGALLTVTDEALGMTTTKTDADVVDAFTTPVPGRAPVDENDDPPTPLSEVAELCRTMHLLNVTRLRRLEGRLVEQYGYGGSGAFGPIVGVDGEESLVPDTHHDYVEDVGEEEMLVEDDDDGGFGGGGAQGASHGGHGQPPLHPGTGTSTSGGEDAPHHQHPPTMLAPLLPSERGMTLDRVSEGSERSSYSSTSTAVMTTPASRGRLSSGHRPRRWSADATPETPATPTIESLKLSGFTSSILLGEGNDTDVGLGVVDDDEDTVDTGGGEAQRSAMDHPLPPPTMERIGPSDDDDVISGSTCGIIVGQHQPGDDVDEYVVDEDEEFVAAVAAEGETAATAMAAKPPWGKTEDHEGGVGGGSGEDEDRGRDEHGPVSNWTATTATGSRSSSLSRSATTRSVRVRSPFEDLIRSPSPAVGGTSWDYDDDEVGRDQVLPSFSRAAARRDVDVSSVLATDDVCHHVNDGAALSRSIPREEVGRGVAVPPSPRPATTAEEDDKGEEEVERGGEVVRGAMQVAAKATVVPENHSGAGDDEVTSGAVVASHDATVGVTAPSSDGAGGTVSGAGVGRRSAVSDDDAPAGTSIRQFGKEQVGSLVGDDAVSVAGGTGEHNSDGGDGGDRQRVGGSSREDVEYVDYSSSVREEDGDDDEGGDGVGHDGVIDDRRSGPGDAADDEESVGEDVDAALSASVDEASVDGPPMDVQVDEVRPLGTSASCGDGGRTSPTVTCEEGVVDNCKATPNSEVEDSTVSSQVQPRRVHQPSSLIEASTKSNDDSTLNDSVSRDWEDGENHDDEDEEEEWETEESIATTVVGNHVRVVVASSSAKKEHIRSPSGPGMTTIATTTPPHRDMSITYCGGGGDGDANDTSTLASPIISAPHDVVVSSPPPPRPSGTGLGILIGGGVAGAGSRRSVGRSPLLSRTPLASAWIAKHMSGGIGGGVGVDGTGTGTSTRSPLVDDAVRRLLEDRRRSSEHDHSAGEALSPSSEAPTVSSSVPEIMVPPTEDAKEAIKKTVESTVDFSSLIKDVSKDEYDSAPRVVKMQVSYEQVNSAVEVLNSRWNQKCNTVDASGVQKMHFTEEEAYAIVREKFGERKGKSVLMSLCHWRRLIIEFTGGAGDSESKRKLFVLYR